MSQIIIFDTETTGIPNWKTPSGGDDQPHIVSLAALMVEEQTKEVIQTLNLIVKPDGWEIPQETIDVHGITNELAAEVGVPEEAALNIFLNLWNGRKRIAYNTTFDNRIIRIATKRYKNEQVIVNWKDGQYECAMIGSKKVMGGKNPKLEAAYKYFMGTELEGAHDALVDTKACMDVYFAMKEASAEAA